jgi:hypothetical protein
MCRAHDDVPVLPEREIRRLSIHLACGRHKNRALLLAGLREHDLRAVDVGFDGSDRTLDNELHPYRRGQVVDVIGRVNELGNEAGVVTGVDRIAEARLSAEMAEVLD